MARIRTIKPEYFRHELLQDLEREHGDLKPMLVFQGLWIVSDKNGVFEWKPRQLKLDILPFLDFDMADSMSILSQSGFIVKFEHNGKDYGFIPTFKEHQRITGKEATSPGRYPEPSREDTETQQGNTRDTPEKQQGAQEREKERNGYTPDFETFWSSYPKRSGSKKAAFDNWKKLNGQRPELVVILTAIDAQKKWRENANGEFRPEWKDPERWIKNRMWEVETGVKAAAVKKPSRLPTPEEELAEFNRTYQEGE